MLFVHWPESVFTAMFAGQVTVGGSVSPITVTVNVQLTAKPAASFAVQVTDVVPTGKLLPEGGVQVTVTVPPQLLVARTV